MILSAAPSPILLQKRKSAQGIKKSLLLFSSVCRFFLMYVVGFDDEGCSDKSGGGSLQQML